MQSDAPDHAMMRSLAERLLSGGRRRMGRTHDGQRPSSASGPSYPSSANSSKTAASRMRSGWSAGSLAASSGRLNGWSSSLKTHASWASSLAATKAVIEKWVALSVHFVQEQQYQSLQARRKVLVDARAAEKKAGVGAGWR